MGKGDRKTRRGKLFKGSYGVRRRKKSSQKSYKPAVAKKTEEKS